MPSSKFIIAQAALWCEDGYPVGLRIGKRSITRFISEDEDSVTELSQDWASSFKAGRYTGAAFPPYRFLPGRDPHPTADPRGHSYRPPGEPEPAIDVVPPEKWADCEPYLLGCDLYNHAYWWEAHEEWEGLWRAVPKGSVQHRFLQGLIQVSACHLKLRMASAQGVAQLRQTYRAHLEYVIARIGTARFMGLDVADFLSRVDAYYDGIVTVSGDLGRHDPESFPYCLPSRESMTQSGA